MRAIYLDHNATTPVDPAVLEAMLPWLGADAGEDSFGNPSSVHSFGQRARGAVERSRLQVAALIGARPSEIVFTSGGTESDNAAIFGVFPPGESSHVVTTAIEHPAVLGACAALERRGVAVTYVAVGSDGVVDPDDVRRALQPGTRLISVMHANNELGTIQPIAEIGRIAAEAGVLFHCDEVQSAGKLPIFVDEMRVHLLSLSAHKFCGPKGTGALFVRKGIVLEPLLYGGHSERERRAGTENVAGIVGMGQAATLARDRLAEDAAPEAVQTRDIVSERARTRDIKTRDIKRLRDRLEKGLLDRIPGARINSGAAPRIDNTSNLLFPGVDSEALIIALDLAGVACSAGAACSSGVVDASHVLLAIGLSADEARSSVRLSLGRTTTEEEIDLALELIPAAVARQRQLSSPGKYASREMAARR